MTKYARKEKFIKDPISRRLGNLAVNLNRVGVFAEKNTPESVRNLLDESIQFIEWTAADTSPETTEILIRYQVQLAHWKLSWEKTWFSPNGQETIILQTKKMSDSILEIIQ
jgi:hypothetical protein